jgi:serine protease Do
MTTVPPRQRLIGLTATGLLLLGVALAGLALRADPAPVPGVRDPSAQQAVRQATSLSEAFVAIAETVTPSVVRIEVERTATVDIAPLSGRLDDPFDRLRPLPEPVPQVGGGSGFIVSEDGYILTNYHVIAEAQRISVTLRDKRVLEAEVVGADPTTDVAVIRVRAEGLPAARLGNSDEARVGEWVIAVGNPGFEDANTLDFTVTGGIISAKGRPLNILNAELAQGDPAAAGYAIEDFIQTDAVINPGNSGGPLVDLRGTVIGINTAIATTTGYSQGYGFAVPSNLAQRVMRDLIEYGYVRRALLGVSIMDVTQEDAEVYGLERIAGVVVEDVGAESPAAAAGVQRHDVITAVDGTAVERVGQLQRLVALHRPGEQITLSIVRYGRNLRIRVQLMEVAGHAPPARQAPAATTAQQLGLELDELTPLLARQLGFAQAGGVIISRVVPGSTADRKVVEEMRRLVTIDRQPVESVDQARALLAGARSGSVISLLLERADGRTLIFNIRVP